MIIHASREYSELNKIYEKIKKFCSNKDIAISSDINLILDEVFSNILKYSGTQQSRETIVISVEKYKESVELQITYHGRYFDILKYQNPPLPNLSGKVGIPIIKSFAKKIFYKHRKNCNILTFFLPLGDII